MMLKRKVLACCLLAVAANLQAQNPIIQTHYTTDPAPMVYGDTLYLYVGCDEPDAPKDSYLMREYRLYTTTDMVNWTDHGTPLKPSDFSWSAGDASAAQCVPRNGKFYWYISSQNSQSPGSSIGVAVDDGQAWLYWGNGVCYRAKLNDDMVSLGGEIEAIDRLDKSLSGGFTEAPWVYRRDGHYYLVYASGFPESIHYSMGKSIDGKWKAQGVVMPTERGSNTNHPGIVDYKGHSYFFYHNDALPGGHSYCRSVCVEEFTYGKGGRIPEIHMTDSGILKGVGTLDPYRRVEAETMAWSEGVTTDADEERGVYVTDIHHGDYIKLRDVDFGTAAALRFTAAASSRYFGGEIELRADSLDGKLMGTLRVPYTGEWENWKEFTTQVEGVTGVHDLYLVFKGRKPHALFNLDYWRFER